MTDFTEIINIIHTINDRCREMDSVEAKNALAIREERNDIDEQSADLISDMESKYAVYKQMQFERVRDWIRAPANLLCEEYLDEWNATTVTGVNFNQYSFQDNEKLLRTLISRINDCIKELNAVDFDLLVPPVMIEQKEDFFYTYTGKRDNRQKHDSTAQPRSNILDPKPLADVVKRTFAYCKKAFLCIDALEAAYDKQFRASNFAYYVKRKAGEWFFDFEKKKQAEYDARFDELFVANNAKAIPESFFLRLAQEGIDSEVDPNAVSTRYRDALTIGKVRLTAEESAAHLAYLRKSPVLNKYLDHGRLLAPVILDLKKKGNLLLNVYEDAFGAGAIDFVNELILRFLLAFPVGKIKFCLVDVDNKIGFSHFKSLTKISPDILCKGIIRDDRALEDTIKDMEQTMYGIDEDYLSFNGVKDIFEYNARFPSNPQCMHLFVLVNYPSGIRDDLSKRVANILQNGNKSGIFSIVVNNKSHTHQAGFSDSERRQFETIAEKSGVMLEYRSGVFNLAVDVKNAFEPKKDLSLSRLPDIIDMQLKHH